MHKFRVNTNFCFCKIVSEISYIINKIKYSLCVWMTTFTLILKKAYLNVFRETCIQGLGPYSKALWTVVIFAALAYSVFCIHGSNIIVWGQNHVSLLELVRCLTKRWLFMHMCQWVRFSPGDSTYKPLNSPTPPKKKQLLCALCHSSYQSLHPSSVTARF